MITKLNIVFSFDLIRHNVNYPMRKNYSYQVVIFCRKCLVLAMPRDQRTSWKMFNLIAIVWLLHAMATITHQYNTRLSCVSWTLAMGRICCAVINLIDVAAVTKMPRRNRIHMTIIWLEKSIFMYASSNTVINTRKTFHYLATWNEALFRPGYFNLPKV